LKLISLQGCALAGIPSGRNLYGGKGGQRVKVCADPNCRIHHPNTRSPQQIAKERAAERKFIEKEEQTITTLPG